MNQPATSLTLIALTLIAAAGSVLAWYRLRRGERRGNGRGEGRGDAGQSQMLRRWHVALVCVLIVGGAAVLVVRWEMAGALWEPLHAHVDGLVLIATLLAAVVLYMVLRPGWFGISAFALPLITLILAWAICASAWTYRPFNLPSITPVWSALHLVGVYLGTLFAALGAIAGGMYLYVQYRLKHKATPPRMGRLASLESLETVVVRAATGGFILLSLGLVAGLVVVAERPEVLGPGWWHGPKVILATLVWLVYAVLFNVRFTAGFRGARAAWLAIVGLVLLLVAYGVITSMPDEDRQAIEPTATASNLRVSAMSPRQTCRAVRLPIDRSFSPRNHA